MIALKIIGLVFTILIVINFVSAIPTITNRYFSEKQLVVMILYQHLNLRTRSQTYIILFMMSMGDMKICKDITIMITNLSMMI